MSFLFMAGGLCSVTVIAQPDLSRRTGKTIADVGSEVYTFYTLRLDSADGLRHYRVRMGVPKGVMPCSGFPALYLLDGNAALMETSEAALQRLHDVGHPPVLIFIATDNDLRIDSDARAFDYTPVPLLQNSHDDVLGRRNGGADAFLELITKKIRPQVAALVKVDAKRQTLWGHSFGGLFVLHTLFTQPQAFTRYVAVDASLWWAQGQVLNEAKTLVSRKSLQVPASLLLLSGSGKEAAKSSTGGADDKRVQAMQAARAAIAADEPAQLAKTLAGISGLNVQTRELAGLSHGQTLGASLPLAMDFAGEL